MDVSKQLPTLGNGEATLQDSRGVAPVQLSVDCDERLGPPGDTSCLSAVRGLHPSVDPVEELVTPVLRKWGLVNLHCLVLIRQGGLGFCHHGFGLVYRGVPVNGLGR